MKIETGSPWLAMNRSVEGVKRSGTGMAKAAAGVAESTVEILNHDFVAPQDRVTLSTPADLDDAMMDLKRNSHGYSANLKAVKVSDEAIESMLDMFFPHDSGRDG